MNHEHVFSQYPIFTIITPNNVKYINYFNQNYKHYCTFTDINLINWNLPDAPTLVSILNKNLVIKTPKFVLNGYYISFIGNNQLSQTTKTILNDYGELNIIPEEIALKLKRKFKVEEDLMSHNYIFSTKQIAMLNKKLYKDKARQIKKFFCLYNNFYINELDLTNDIDKINSYKLLKKWESQKGIATIERNAIENYIKNAGSFHTLDIGFYLDNQLVAFTFNDISNKSMVDGIFGKGDHTYKYIATIYEYYTSQILYLKGYQYINLEMDSGIENFRREKLSWKPCKLLKMYNIYNK